MHIKHYGACTAHLHARSPACNKHKTPLFLMQPDFFYYFFQNADLFFFKVESHPEHPNELNNRVVIIIIIIIIMCEDCECTIKDANPSFSAAFNPFVHAPPRGKQSARCHPAPESVTDQRLVKSS